MNQITKSMRNATIAVPESLPIRERLGELSQTPQVVIRHHTKSRTGCSSCKTRRVKCGEERPSCERCVKAGFDCEYAPPEIRKGRTVSQRPHFKSRAGCVICKARRVKCDEKRPSCSWCVKAGKDCHYEVQEQPQSQSRQLSSVPRRKNLAPGITSLKLNLVPENGMERRSFEFYLSELGQQLAGSFDVAFWTQTIVQRSFADPALWHSLVALGMLEESSAADDVTRRNTGMQHYNKAVRSVAMSKPDNTTHSEHLIVSAIIFCIIEVSLGDIEKACFHLMSGVRMIDNWKMANPSPQPHQKEFFSAVLDPVYDHMISLSGLHDFLTVFDALEKDVARFAREHGRSTQLDPSGLHAATAYRDDLLDRTDVWVRAFKETIDLPRLVDVKYEEEDGIACLLFRHKVLEIRLKNLLPTDEVGFDAYVDSFREALEHAETGLKAVIRRGPKFSTSRLPPVSKENPTLFTLLSKCRNPQLRRQALDLMTRAKGQDVFKIDDLWIKVAERVIEIEEQGMEDLRDPTGAVVPSGWVRICRTTVLPDVEEGEVGTRCAMMAYMQQGKPGQESLEWTREYILY